MDTRRRVATVITRCIAGSGGVAVRGMLGLDPERYRCLLVTGQGGPLVEQAAAHGLDVVVLDSLISPLRPRQDLRAQRDLLTTLAAYDPQVVHTHSSKTGVLGRVAAHRLGVERVVHTMHGFPWHQFQNPATRQAYIAIERQLSRWTDAYLAVGTAVAVEMVRRGLAGPGQLHTVGPAVDAPPEPVTQTSRAAARARLGIPPEVPVVGTVGRLDYQKAPEVMIAAIARMQRPAVLVWVGAGPLRQDAERLVRRHALDDRVLLLGERNDVPDLLPAFDVFAMSSRYEGLPCAVVEAQQCGIPVVATAVNAVPDVVVPGETGLLVPPQDTARLAAALDHALAHPELARGWALRARAALGTRFDTTTACLLLDQLYRAPAPTRASRPSTSITAAML
ncbi:MAG: glycosyltransferase [Ornithinimicrobium sp.]